MTLTKSLLTAFSALALSTGAAFAGGSASYDTGGPELHAQADSFGSESMALDSLESGDRAYFAESEGAMTDPITTANSGQMMEYDVYYIVPMEVVEVQEIWLFPSGDSESPQG